MLVICSSHRKIFSMISDQLPATPHLLAIDLGLHFAWALYTLDAQLIGYSSHHCPHYRSLKGFAALMLRRLPIHSYVYIEGGGTLLKAWSKPCTSYQHHLVQLHAKEWRDDVFTTFHSPNLSSKEAKKQAIHRASSVIKTASHKGHHTLRHDSAEAVLLGWWALWKQQKLSTANFKAALH